MKNDNDLSRRLFLGGLASGAATPLLAQTVGPQIKQPGVYVEEIPSGLRSIKAPETSVALFVDIFGGGALQTVASISEFDAVFGAQPGADAAALENVRLFFNNGGRKAIIASVRAANARAIVNTKKTGLRALLKGPALGADFICVPPAALIDAASAGRVYSEALKLAHREKAMLFMDAPPSAGAFDASAFISQWPGALGIDDPNAALFAPRLLSPGFASGSLPASGAVAGVAARIDAARGIWKAPAGMDASISGAAPEAALTDAENGILNQANINAIRTFPNVGAVVWGARTMSSDPEWRYVPVRRTALFIEKALDEGLQWAVFEPNDEPLWAQIRLSIENFMEGLFRQGAFQGASAHEAYFVRCDRSTTTQADIDRGVCNIVIGFAPTRPAEFIILRRTQKTAGA